MWLWYAIVQLIEVLAYTLINIAFQLGMIRHDALRSCQYVPAFNLLPESDIISHK